MMNWMLTKATYDQSVGGTLSAKLDAISLRVGLDPTITPQMLPQMSPFPDQLSRPWEPEALAYGDEDEEDEDEE